MKQRRAPRRDPWLLFPPPRLQVLPDLKLDVHQGVPVLVVDLAHGLRLAIRLRISKGMLLLLQLRMILRDAVVHVGTSE